MRTLLAFTAPLALALGLGACVSETDPVAAICTALCDCQTALPGVHRTCVAECSQEVPSNLPATCVDCVLEASCAELLGDGCDAACSIDEPPQPVDLSSTSPETISSETSPALSAMDMP